MLSLHDARPISRQASRAPVHEGQAAVPDKGIRLDCLTAAQRWKYHGRLPGHHALLSGKSHVSSSAPPFRSEEHTSELQSLMRISYAVFCLKKTKIHNSTTTEKTAQINPL